ncbi:GON-4-like protein isoform X2 [Protopterus annectens]|nr:GON-4-like protein isoform X2 [Protopterus annectens]
MCLQSSSLEDVVTSCLTSKRTGSSESSVEEQNLGVKQSSSCSSNHGSILTGSKDAFPGSNTSQVKEVTKVQDFNVAPAALMPPLNEDAAVSDHRDAMNLPTKGVPVKKKKLALSSILSSVSWKLEEAEAHCQEEVTVDDGDGGLFITLDEEEDADNNKKKRKKRGRTKQQDKEEESTVACSVDFDDSLDKCLDDSAKQHNLTTVNVKNIIHEVITNEQVVAMMKAAISETQDMPMFEPKMTRSKLKEVVEKGVVIPSWNISPIKKIHEVKPPQFVDMPLEEEEDSSDEEYQPEEDEEDETAEESMMESDVETSSTASSPQGSKKSHTKQLSDHNELEEDGRASLDKEQPAPQPVRHISVEVVPMGPPPVPKPNQSKDCAFMEKLHAVDEELDLTSVCMGDSLQSLDDSLIACRTRSKRPLKDVPLERLEAELQAPDITPDMYDQGIKDDEDWQKWLVGLMNNVVENEDDADDPDDPEYNFLEDLDEPDVEDFRNDRAVRITKKEVNELMEELFETFCSEKTPRREKTVPAEGRTYKRREAQDEIRVQEPKTQCEEDNRRTTYHFVTFNIPKVIRFEEPLANMINERHKTVKAQLELLRQKRAAASVKQTQKTEVTKVKITRPSEPLVLDAKQKFCLQQQMQQHVQLLTQLYLLFSVNPNLSSEAENSKMFLKELTAFAENSELVHRSRNPLFQSTFHSCNLKEALELIQEFDKTLKPNIKLSPKKKTTKKYANEYPCLPQQIAWIIATRRVFMYPELLPVCSLERSPQDKSFFSKAEDCLLALGLKHFEETEFPKPLISKYLLAAKGHHQISARIKNLNVSRAPDNVVKYYKRKKVLPPLARWFDYVFPQNMKPPFECDKQKLPFWLQGSLQSIQEAIQCLQEKTKNECFQIKQVSEPFLGFGILVQQLFKVEPKKLPIIMPDGVTLILKPLGARMSRKEWKAKKSSALKPLPIRPAPAIKPSLNVINSKKSPLKLTRGSTSFHKFRCRTPILIRPRNALSSGSASQSLDNMTETMTASAVQTTSPFQTTSPMLLSDGRNSNVSVAPQTTASVSLFPPQTSSAVQQSPKVKAQGCRTPRKRGRQKKKLSFIKSTPFIKPALPIQPTPVILAVPASMNVVTVGNRCSMIQPLSTTVEGTTQTAPLTTLLVNPSQFTHSVSQPLTTAPVSCVCTPVKSPSFPVSGLVSTEGSVPCSLVGITGCEVHQESKFKSHEDTKCEDEPKSECSLKNISSCTLNNDFLNPEDYTEESSLHQKQESLHCSNETVIKVNASETESNEDHHGRQAVTQDYQINTSADCNPKSGENSKSVLTIVAAESSQEKGRLREESKREIILGLGQELEVEAPQQNKNTSKAEKENSKENENVDQDVKDTEKNIIKMNDCEMTEVLPDTSVCEVVQSPPKISLCEVDVASCRTSDFKSNGTSSKKFVCEMDTPFPDVSEVGKTPSVIAVYKSDVSLKSPVLELNEGLPKTPVGEADKASSKADVCQVAEKSPKAPVCEINEVSPKKLVCFADEGSAKTSVGIVEIDFSSPVEKHEDESTTDGQSSNTPGGPEVGGEKGQEEEEEEDFDDLTQDEEDEEVMSSASEESVLSVPELQETMERLTWLASERRLSQEGDSEEENSQEDNSEPEEEEEGADIVQKGEETADDTVEKTTGKCVSGSTSPQVAPEVESRNTTQGGNAKAAGKAKTSCRSRSKRGRSRVSKDTSKLLLLCDEDILENDPQREQKDMAFAHAYLTRVKEVLRNTSGKYEEFLRVLYEFETDPKQPSAVDLYMGLRDILQEWPQLLKDFAAFLLPEQALECGLFEEQQAFDKSRKFLRQLEICFGENPSHYQKIIKALQSITECQPQEVSELKTQVWHLLKGHHHLQEEFSLFFDQLRPPASRMGDFEVVSWTEEKEYEFDGFEEVVLPDLDEEEDSQKIQTVSKNKRRKELAGQSIDKTCDAKPYKNKETQELTSGSPQEEWSPHTDARDSGICGDLTKECQDERDSSISEDADRRGTSGDRDMCTESSGHSGTPDMPPACRRGIPSRQSGITNVILNEVGDASKQSEHLPALQNSEETKTVKSKAGFQDVDTTNGERAQQNKTQKLVKLNDSLKLTSEANPEKKGNLFFRTSTPSKLTDTTQDSSSSGLDKETSPLRTVTQNDKLHDCNANTDAHFPEVAPQDYTGEQEKTFTNVMEGNCLSNDLHLSKSLVEMHDSVARTADVHAVCDAASGLQKPEVCVSDSSQEKRDNGELLNKVTESLSCLADSRKETLSQDDLGSTVCDMSELNAAVVRGPLNEMEINAQSQTKRSPTMKKESHLHGVCITQSVSQGTEQGKNKEPAVCAKNSKVISTGEKVVLWTREDDRVILTECQENGASQEVFIAIANKLGSKSPTEVSRRFRELLRLFHTSCDNSSEEDDDGTSTSNTDQLSDRDLPATDDEQE